MYSNIDYINILYKSILKKKLAPFSLALYSFTNCFTSLLYSFSILSVFCLLYNEKNTLIATCTALSLMRLVIALAYYCSFVAFDCFNCPHL